MQYPIDKSDHIPVKQLLGVDVSIVDIKSLLQQIDRLAQKARPSFVNNVNIHAYNLAVKQPEFRHVLNQSDIVFCDGYGVKLAGWLTGIRFGQRMTPPDWIDQLFELCVSKGYGIYFIGDEEEVVSNFVQLAQKNYPGLNVVGWQHGFFDIHDSENETVVRQMAESHADIIITGMGMPRQELWAWNARETVHKGVFIATGALFRWYTGYEQRAPKWMTDNGLEWLARLFVQPRRHFRRYVIGIPVFYWRVLAVHRLKIKGILRG